MATATARRAFTRVALTDPADIVASIASFIDQVDAQMGSITQGTLLARPTTGKDGDYYWARDDTTLTPNGTPWIWDSANAAWRLPSRAIGIAAGTVAAGNDSRFNKVFQLAHHFLIPGPVNVPSGQLDYIPTISVPIVSGQTVKAARVRYRVNNGAAGVTVSFKIQRNGADMTGFGTTAAPIVTPTSNAWTETDPTDVALTPNDELALVVTAISGAPQNLSVSMILEHAV